MENVKVCFCVRYAKLKISWTNLNPGRRFWTCRNGGCAFFQWMEPPMCDRSKAIIPGLLKKKNIVEDENKRIKSREKKWICCVIICVIWILFLLFNRGDVEDGSSKSEI